MGRKPRLHYPGALFHVICRGNNKRAVFPDAEALDYFSELVGAHCREFDCRLHVYCWMNTHAHMVLEARKRPVGAMIHALLPKYARYFHGRFGTVGHVFYRPHREIHCDSDRYLLALLRYIHRNPIRAGLVEKPEDWAHSSARAYLGAHDPLLTSERVLSALPGPGTGPQRYAAFMNQEVPFAPPPEDPILGALPALLESTAWELGMTGAQLRSPARYPEFMRARREFVRRAIASGGSLKNIADLLGRTPSAVCQLAK